MSAKEAFYLSLLKEQQPMSESFLHLSAGQSDQPSVVGVMAGVFSHARPLLTRYQTSLST